MATRLLAALATLTVLAACGRDARPAAQPSTTSAPATTTPASPTTEPATRPERIVSLSASLTEMLYAIGAGDEVIAVDKYSDFPAGTPLTDLSGFKPNVEAIAALTPDLVVVSGDRDGIVAALETVGIPTLLLEPAETIDDTYAEITALGDATGHTDEAVTTVAAIRDELARISATAPQRELPLSYYYELADDGHTVTSATFIGNVLGRAGLTSIADAAPAAAGGYPQLSTEAVLAADPDVVFVAHTDGENPTMEELAARPGWSELRAIREQHVVTLDPDIASRWGPRIVDLLAAAVNGTASIP